MIADARGDRVDETGADPDGDLKDDIADEWKELRDWQKEHDFEKVQGDGHDAIRK